MIGVTTKIAAGLAVAVLAAGAGASTGRTDAGRIPDGAYRANVSEAFLREVGLSAVEAAHNGGLQTLVFKGGRWTGKTTMNRFHPPDCPGDLSYSGGRVTLALDAGPGCARRAGQLLFSARWSYRHGQLRFTAIEPNDLFSRAAWGGKPWTKVG